MRMRGPVGDRGAPLAQHAPRELPAWAVGPPHPHARGEGQERCPGQRAAGSTEVPIGEGPRALPAAPGTGHGAGTPGAVERAAAAPSSAGVRPHCVAARGPPQGLLTLADGILQQPLATRGLQGLGAEQAPGQRGQGQPAAALLLHLEMRHLGEQPHLLLQQLHQRPVLLLQLHCGRGQVSTWGGRGHPGEQPQGRGPGPDRVAGLRFDFLAFITKEKIFLGG